MAFTFTYPPNRNDNPDSIVLELGSSVKVSWTTTMDIYSIHLSQNVDLDGLTRQSESILYTKEPENVEQGGFLWNTALLNISDSDASFLELFASVSSVPPSQNSSYTQPFSFNTADHSVEQNSSTGATGSTGSTSSTGAAGSAGAAGSTNPSSSSPKLSKGLIIGISTGLAVLLLKCLGMYLYFHCRNRRRRRSKATKNKLESIAPSTTPAGTTNTVSEINPTKAELPTLFNTPRSMKATFLSRFELPGKENEVNLHGRFELDGAKCVGER